MVPLKPAFRINESIASIFVQAETEADQNKKQNFSQTKIAYKIWITVSLKHKSHSLPQVHKKPSCKWDLIFKMEVFKDESCLQNIFSNLSSPDSVIITGKNMYIITS